MISKTSLDELEKAIKLKGTQAALADDLGLKTSMAITQWKKRGVPLKRALEIEALLNHQVKASKLCPLLRGKLSKAA